MEIAHRIQPGNVNLRAYVAGRKRAHNSSIRAEGRWHVQHPFWGCMQKTAPRCSSSSGRVASLCVYLRRFYSRSEYCWWSVKFNERIKNISQFMLRIFIQRVCRFIVDYNDDSAYENENNSAVKTERSCTRKKFFHERRVLYLVFSCDFAVCYTLIGSNCNN